MNERKLTKSELAKREDIIMKMKKNKRALTQKYGKDAEAVMYGRATKLAKKQSESMDQDKIKELVKDALQNPKKADLNKDGKLSDYEKKRGAAIEKAMVKELDLDLKGGTEKDKDADIAGVVGAEDVLGLEEGFYGSSDIEDVTNALGYSDPYEFFQDNPGAINALMDWVESVPEFRDMLKDADLLQEGASTEEKRIAMRAIKSIAKYRGVSNDEARNDLIRAAKEIGDLNEENIGLADLGERGYIAGEKAAYTYGTLVTKLQNRPDKLAYNKGFIQGVKDELGSYLSEDLTEDLDLGHQDNEPHMLKADLYRIGKYAMELYQMLDKFEGGSEEVDLPHWWQSKIIKSKDAIVGAKHYLDFELKEPQIDAMVDVAQDVEAINEFDDESMTAYQKAVKKVYRPKYDGSIQMPSQEVVDAFFKKIGKEYHYLANKPVFGDLEPWDDYDYSNWKSITRGHKLNEADLDEARGPINLKAAMDALNKSKYVDGVKIRQGNKFTGIKSIEVNARLLGDLVVTKDGEVFWKHKGRTWGWDSPSIEHLIKTIEKLSAEEELNKQSPKNLSRTDVNEGVWSLGSAKSIKNIIGILDMALDIKDPQELMDLMDMHDKSMYNIVGDDVFHDDIDGAKRELAQNNLDRAYNRLIDAKGRAEDLLKIASENDLKNPPIFEEAPGKADIFTEVASKLAKQLKSK